MAKHGKRFRGDIDKVDRDKAYPLDQAVKFIKTFKDTKFDQSVELCLNLGIDAKQADQAIRGAVSLPHGIGASKRVIAFCPPDKVDEAKAAGAVEAGGEDLVKKIEEGWMDFDVAVATPDMMRVISKLGRVLGPRGLMPSPKAGTVSPEVDQTVRDYAAGKVEFRNDKDGNVHAVIGKKSFEEKQLEDNATHFIDMIRKMRPSSTKGHYIRKISMSATMTPGVQVEA
jgi:large subunit ribosomal protein L1